MADQDHISVLPKEWRTALREFAIERTAQGMGGASVLRLRSRNDTELYLKIVHGAAVSELRNEIERTKWLEKRGVRVPEIIRVHEDSSLGACLMTVVAGRHPQESFEEIPQLMRDLASGLRSLHSIPAADCAFDESISVRLTRARRMISAGLVRTELFAERNQGLSPQNIYDRLVQSIPEREQNVLVHGDATFGNLLVDDNGTVGFIDCGHAGRGDPYLDLATIIMDIDEHFGSEAIDLFASSYGLTTIDTKKLEFFSDLYELF
jgi:aminoglycoside 3'-phosphotransferase II